jgi:U3 small nucleolar RNA-associated protein 24
MGRAKQTRKFAVTKKLLSPKDTRVRENAVQAQAQAAQKKAREAPRHVEQAVSALFFQYNTQLGPPYHVLVDTNFINFSIRYVPNRRSIGQHVVNGRVNSLTR